MTTNARPLEGKVAIVTGAGRGLGRAEALALAAHGARVVINDLGVAGDGSGADEGPAREVVAEIERAGGEAIAHFGDVARWDDAAALVARAVDVFGDLHVLVNNAGFSRDRMIFNMSEQDWDSVIRVHLKGHFCTSRFATAHWREQAKVAGGPVYGRIVNTASEAFLFGPAGLANYAAAKSGIVGLTVATAHACEKYGVTANVVCPRARTRMNSEGSLGALFAKPEQGFDTYDPANVAPLVAYLASPAAGRINAHVFLAWGTQVCLIGAPRVLETFMSDARWTVDRLDERVGRYLETRDPASTAFAAELPGI